MKNFVTFLVVVFISSFFVFGQPNTEKNFVKTIVEVDKPNLDESNFVFEEGSELINNFTYKTAPSILNMNHENSNYSPVSLYFALSLANFGAEGETKKQIDNLLGDLNNYKANKLFKSLYCDEENLKLFIANSIWIDNDFSFKNSYLENARDSFYSSLFSINFEDEKTSDYISNWINKKTLGLLSPELNIPSETIASIINTIYFKGQWIDQFNNIGTNTNIFHSEKEDLKTLFMNKTDNGSIIIGDGWKRSSLNMEGNAKVTFILPDENNNIWDLIEKQGIEELLNAGIKEYGSISWSVPKFSFDTKFKLKPILHNLGIEDAFSDKADFSNMSEQPIFISDILQGTTITLDENGVEAAAYTAIMMEATCCLPLKYFEMTLNKPFLFVVEVNSSIAFIGVLANPNK